MKVIEKINLFYKQANNKDEKLSILVHNFVTSCDWFLDTLLAAYSDYFRSLGNSEANKKRLESYSASIKNAKDSLFVLSKNFLQTKVPWRAFYLRSLVKSKRYCLHPW